MYTIAVALLLVKIIILIPVEKTGVCDSSGANGSGSRSEGDKCPRSFIGDCGRIGRQHFEQYTNES